MSTFHSNGTVKSPTTKRAAKHDDGSGGGKRAAVMVVGAAKKESPPPVVAASKTPLDLLGDAAEHTPLQLLPEAYQRQCELGVLFTALCEQKKGDEEWWAHCRQTAAWYLRFATVVELELARRSVSHTEVVHLKLAVEPNTEPVRIQMEDETVFLVPQPDKELPLPYEYFARIANKKGGASKPVSPQRYRSHALVDIGSFRKACGALAPIVSMPSMIARNGAVTREWTRLKGEREAWCTAHGHIDTFAEFTRICAEDVTLSAQTTSSTWALYNETWDRLAGMRVFAKKGAKHPPQDAALSSSSSSSSAIAQQEEGDAMEDDDEEDDDEDEEDDGAEPQHQ